ncbi:non-selective voltage-gated ion channel VDAC1 isoform X4 [Lithobates pipiens]
MAIPPPYADLGKSARDVFTKGYGFGFIKLDLKTKSENGLEFISSGSANAETSKVTGSLETKYKWAEYGLTFTEKWNTDNALGTEITVEDQLAKGLKLTFDSSFSPNTGLGSADSEASKRFGWEKPLPHPHSVLNEALLLSAACRTYCHHATLTTPHGPAYYQDQYFWHC